MLELLLDACLSFEPLDECRAFDSCATEPLIERLDLVFHVGEPKLVFGFLLFERLVLVAQLVDVVDQRPRQALGAVLHVGQDVRGARNFAQRFLPRQYEHLGSQVTVADLAHDLR